MEECLAVDILEVSIFLLQRWNTLGEHLHDDSGALS
jgi:hypothetical protein